MRIFQNGISNLLCHLFMTGLVLVGLMGAHTRAAQAMPRGEIVFIDRAVADSACLAAALRPGVEVVLLDPRGDELTQVTAALQGRHDLKAMHIVSHGAPGALLLGAQRLDAAALANQADLIRAWRGALGSDSALLLYGCNVAKGPRGRAFLGQLAGLSGARVAGSTNPTGAAALGGDWRLEYGTGDVPTRSPFRPQVIGKYSAILPAPLSTPPSGGNYYVRPGQVGTRWTETRGSLQLSTDIRGYQPSRGVFEYSATGSAPWTPLSDLGSPNYAVNSNIVRYRDTNAADTTTSSAEIHFVSGGNSTFGLIVTPDNPPTDITRDGTAILNAWPAGQLVATVTPTDTGDRTHGYWAIDSQTVPNLFVLTFDASTGNTATLKLGSGTIPAIGSTASVTVRYYDTFQTDDAGIAIPGSGFPKTFTFTVVGDETKDLATFGNNIVVNATTANDQSHPATATLSSGNYVVVWQSAGQGKSSTSYNNICAQIFTPAGVKSGSEIVINNTPGTVDEITPTVAALSGGRFVVAYATTTIAGGTDYDIAFRIVDGAGTVGAQVAANTTTTGNQITPAVATLADGSFVVAWGSQANGEIRSRKFAGPDGTAQGGELLIADGASTQVGTMGPGIVGLSSGDYAIAWAPYMDYYFVKFSIISADSGAVGTAVVTDLAWGLCGPSLAALSGGFVVVSDIYDGSLNAGKDIAGARYDNSGAPQGSSFRINTGTLGIRAMPSVARLSGGGFVVAWDSTNDDFSGKGVFGRRYYENGTAVDAAQFEINQFRSGDQAFPVLAALAFDMFATSWTDTSSGSDIKTRVLLPSFETPTITTISAASGSTLGGTAVTLTGTHFDGLSAVRFGTLGATFTRESSTQITVASPAHAAGLVDITATTAGATSATSVSDEFLYVDPAIANAVSSIVAYNSSDNPITLNITGGASTSVAVSGAASHGTATASGTNITYTPTSGYSGSDSFTYTATNDVGTSGAATVSITVNPPVPIANAVSATVAYGSTNNPIALNITGGTATSVAVATAASHGTATATGTNIRYTPTASYSGSDSFTYTATNAGGTSAAATVSLTVWAPTLAISPVSGTALTGMTTVAYSQTFVASAGTSPYIYGLAVNSGSLPAGLSFNTSTGVLSGTPTSAGTVNFTATATDSSTGTGAFTVSGTYTLTVAAIPVATLTFATPGSASVNLGSSLTNAATSTLSGGSYGAISYSSSDIGVARVHATTGLVTPVSPGTSVITATQAAVLGVNAQASQSYTLTVSALPVGTVAFVFPGAASVMMGGTLTNAASSTLSGGSYGAITYSSANTAVAMVNSSNGVVTPVSAGTVVITATQAATAANAVATGSYMLTVNMLPMGTLTFATPTPVLVRMGQTLTNAATSTLSGGSYGAVTYSSSNTAVATVNASGVVTPVSVGTALITATQAAVIGVNAEATQVCAVSVKLPTPSAPAISSVAAGNGQATISFVAPTDDGGSAITGYAVTASINGVATPLKSAGAASPITVAGLTNHVAYTFTVLATNSQGPGVVSPASKPVIPSPGGLVLVVHDGTAMDEAASVAHLTEQCAKGSGLTVTGSIGLPGSLDGYDQIWDLRFDNTTPLSSAEQAAYLAFLRRGGMLFLMGENLAFATRNDSLLKMLQIAGGGAITLSTPNDSQKLHGVITGPIPVTSMTFLTASGMVLPGNGVSIADDGKVAAAVVWAPGTLSQAPAGGLVMVFDADFMEAAAADSQAFLANLVNYQTRVSKSTPTVSSVQVPQVGTYVAGSVLNFTVHYSGAITVADMPTLPLTLGGNAITASYTSGSGTSDLVYTYAVKNGDHGALAVGAALDLSGSGSALNDVDGFPARVVLTNIGDTAGVLVDGVAPLAPIISSITGTLVSGTAEAGSTVAIYLGSSKLGSTIADANGNWNFTLPLNDLGTLTAVATDVAGNNSSASTGTLVDTSVPVANAVSAMVAADSADNVIPLNITGKAATHVAVSSAASHGTTTAKGTSITYTPAAGFTGSDSFTYTASNSNGDSPAATITIAVSRDLLQAPRISLSTLSEGAVTADVLVNVSGTVAAVNGLLSMTMDGVPIQALPDGRFSSAVRLKEGANTITLVAVDKAGLDTTVTRTVKLEVAAPILSLTQPADGAVVRESHLAVAGQVRLVPGTETADPLASVTYTLNGGQPQVASVAGLSFAFDGYLVAGSNTVEVLAATVSGKTTRLVRTVTLATDTSIAITDPGKDVISTASSYLLKGTVVSNALPVSALITVGSQVYTPTVANGLFEQVIQLHTNRVWPVFVTVKDAQNHSITVVRNLMKASSVTPALFTMADAVRALGIANGLITATAEDVRFDLAPRVNGVSTGDGRIDLEDAVLVLWLASGQAL